MNWYLVYIDGPALINGTFHCDSRRLVYGLQAVNAYAARKIAEAAIPIEGCDEHFVIRDDSPGFQKALEAQIAWIRQEFDFLELMDALMKNDKS